MRKDKVSVNILFSKSYYFIDEFENTVIENPARNFSPFVKRSKSMERTLITS